MNADQLVEFTTDVLFVAIALATFVFAARNPRRANWDAALLFGAFAVALAGGKIAQQFGFSNESAFRILTVVLVLALPYLLLRLVDHFTSVPRWISAIAIGGLAFSVTGFLVATPPYPLWFTLIIVGYFAALEIYGAGRFIAGSRSSTGTPRVRMRAAAYGSLLIGLAILIAGVAAFWPVPTALTRVVALGSALAYVVAFAPPAFLLRGWQEPQLRAFLNAVTATRPDAELRSLVQALEDATTRTIGAVDAAIGLWDADAEELRLDVDGEVVKLRLGEPSLSAQCFAEQRALFTFDIQRDAPKLAALASGRHAKTLLAAPLTARGKRIGVLSVWSQTIPMFVSDELARMQLLADQAALAIDAALVYAELAGANHELAEATRVKTQFLANMSHELRTPLNAILGFSELLEEQLGPRLESRQQRYIRNIRESGMHLLELVNEVLDLSKVEAGRIDLRPETMPLATLVEPTISATKAAADARGVGFETQFPAERNVFVDASRVRQILYNLLSNAVKFTPSGGQVILRMDLDANALQFEVSDTGIGIPTDRHDRVFGTFERLHEGISDATGTGLGLALTKRLVELMRGTISFESADGSGTTFRVMLPDTAGERVAGDRLLIVDDERSDADLIAALATEVGLRSEIVASSTTAIDLARRDPPRAIVLDLRLPDERGEHVLETLKADPATRAIPIIVVTVEDDEGRSRVLGADDHLTKPIDRQRLLSWLRRVAAAPRIGNAAVTR